MMPRGLGCDREDNPHREHKGDQVKSMQAKPH